MNLSKTGFLVPDADSYITDETFIVDSGVMKTLWQDWLFSDYGLLAGTGFARRLFFRRDITDVSGVRLTIFSGCKNAIALATLGISALPVNQHPFKACLTQ